MVTRIWTDGMDDIPPPRDPGLILLKWLVIALTATMLVGMVVLVTLFIVRFPRASAPAPTTVDLPDGLEAQAFTRGRDWIAIVTESDEILIYDLDGRTLRQRIVVN